MFYSSIKISPHGPESNIICPSNSGQRPGLNERNQKFVPSELRTLPDYFWRRINTLLCKHYHTYISEVKCVYCRQI